VTSSRRNQTPAEHRAAVEATARDRLDQGKQALESLHAHELAEAEALALARIRIQTDQMLAKQAEALLEAERKAQRVAIERREVDIEAAKAARHKLELEAQARSAGEAKTMALQAATLAAQEKFSALEALTAAQAERRQALAEVKVRARQERQLRWQARWLSLRLLPLWQGGLLALVLGLALGYGLAQGEGEGSLLPHSPSSAAADTPLYRTDAASPPVQLRLSRELGSSRF